MHYQHKMKNIIKKGNKLENDLNFKMNFKHFCLELISVGPSCLRSLDLSYSTNLQELIHGFPVCCI